MKYLFIQLFIFLTIFWKISANIILLDSVSGIVGRGNFTHWSLGYTGHIILTLTTLEGDADLYVTDKNYKPSYEPDRYELHAASCGVDIVEIPRNFHRPVRIGIYGHPSYENSSYLLEIQYDIEKSQIKDHFDSFTDINDQDNEVDNYQEDEKDTSFTGIKKFKIKGKILAGIWSLLEIFDILFTF